MDNVRPGTSVIDALAIGALALETIGVAVVAVGYGIYGALDGGLSGLGWSLAAVGAFFALALGFFTRAFAQRKRFALGGVLAWQLMQGSVAVWLLGTAMWLALALLVTAAVVTVAVLRRQSALIKAGGPWDEPAPHA